VGQNLCRCGKPAGNQVMVWRDEEQWAEKKKVPLKIVCKIQGREEHL